MDAIYRDKNGNTLAEHELTPGEGRQLSSVKASIGDFNDVIIDVEFEEDSE
jgi:hypothetical protein